MTSERRRLIEACRAAGMYPRNLAQAVDSFMAGARVLELAREVGISKNTATKLFNVLVAEKPLCGCGRDRRHHGWCDYRLAMHGRGQRLVSKGRIKQGRLNIRAMLDEIEALIPSSYPKHARDEMRQSLVLQKLEGFELDIDAARMSGFSGASLPWETSLDAPIDEDRTKLEMIAGEAGFQSHEEAETFDFETHCFGCGARGYIRLVHNHWQCTECGCIIERCCDD